MHKRVAFIIYSLFIIYLGIIILRRLLPPDYIMTATQAMLGLDTPSPGTSYNISFSPDYQWFAGPVVTAPYTSTLVHIRFEVGTTDGTIRWHVIDEFRSQDSGLKYPVFFQWSHDGHWVYYENQSGATPNVCRDNVSAVDLHKVDLQTGEVKDLAPPLGRRLWLSADEAVVVYEGQTDHELVFRNLATGQEHTIQLAMGVDDRINSVIGSPDGTAYIVTLSMHICSPDTNWNNKYPTSSVIRVDAKTMKATTLISEDPRYFVINEWSNADAVLMQDQNWNRWELNPQTGQIKPEGK